ncbi:propionyl-coenzyme A carboxylase alpha polypeptide [Agrobacterium tumefaciens]|uniref:Propionyl-CoA carboxylase alpha chain n=1 Tax=Agrobacterium tumefaciens TaxID=358 RepID=A0A2L2LE01_AGRTU|nr:propionyl-CoA carboxylase alpha chain [Agrobacterium tumefaciens]OCJ69340.1 propionyl-coenzyme A carboxylase alpha polypeptide [Agrobacterium tumefaciens]
MVVFAFAIPPSALPGISPSRGEIGKRRKLCPWNGRVRHLISPLEGEMPGTAEGGNAAHHTANGVSPC